MTNVDTEYVKHWIEQLFDMWKNKNLDLISSLFSSCKHYMEDPFYPVVHDLKEIQKLWSEVENQEDLTLNFDILSVVENSATVRWQSSFKSDETTYVLDGIYFIRFNGSGRCTSFEQWTVEKEPPASP